MKKGARTSKNSITIEHLNVACRHVLEMKAAGITENFAIRTLELFADMYAVVLKGGSVVPHHVSNVPQELWSRAAKELKRQNPDALPKDSFRVEHGTPRRSFAREVLALYEKQSLTDDSMAALVEKRWKLAVITLDEDRALNKKARSQMFDTPDARWKAAKIEFEDDGDTN